MESSHWQPFLEFSSYELGSGGPDPHLQLAAQAALEVKDSDPYEAAWRIGCYMSPYVISTGAAIWQKWGIWDVRNNPERFTNWVKDSWPGWQIRRERRAARTPSKMAASMITYNTWVAENLAEINWNNYEDLWDSTDKNLLFYGRYANIKILEGLFRAGLVKNAMPDIRPAGAWSPRKTLAWLFPDDEEVIVNGKNRTDTIGLINDRTQALREAVSVYVGSVVSNFQIEVLLCNYRQVLDTRNGRYAGWSQDADLMYHQKVVQFFGALDFDFYGYRSQLFPHEFLGELQGWSEPRKELCGYKGYFWSDHLYDYHKTKDYHNPIKRVQHDNYV